jgi:hypothetical protein
MRTSKFQPRTETARSRCWMFGAGCPSQPRSSRKPERRSGHLARGNGGNGELATLPTVVVQMMIPRARNRLKPTKGANGRRTDASPAVTATLIEANVLGCSDRVGARTTHPVAGRNVGAGGATEAKLDAAVFPPSAKAKAQRAGATRTVICWRLRTDSPARSRDGRLLEHLRRALRNSGPAAGRVPLDDLCREWRSSSSLFTARRPNEPGADVIDSAACAGWIHAGEGHPPGRQPAHPHTGRCTDRLQQQPCFRVRELCPDANARRGSSPRTHRSDLQDRRPLLHGSSRGRTIRGRSDRDDQVNGENLPCSRPLAPTPQRALNPKPTRRVRYAGVEQGNRVAGL